jgi:hypothetical protein
MGLGSEIRDPRSGKKLFRIPDPGVKKAPDPGSGSATLDNSQKDTLQNVNLFYMIMKDFPNECSQNLKKSYTYIFPAISFRANLLLTSLPTLPNLIPIPSVANPGCLSRIPDPVFYPSRIPDPKTATKERGEKN